MTPRPLTPKELLERGELEPGEEVWLDGPDDMRICRHLSRSSPDIDGRYFAYRLHPGPVQPEYLYQGGYWDRGYGKPHEGHFDTLPELLDALYVATLHEESSRIPETAHVIPA